MSQSAVSKNWYVLVSDLEPPRSPLTIAQGLAVNALSSPLTVFDLAATGAVGFRAWATLEPLASQCRAEIQSAEDAATTPGYDSLNRVWLASVLLTLRGFGRHLCLAASAYSWDRIAGHQKRTAETFKHQASIEGIDAAVFASKRDLPSFHRGLLEYHTKRFFEPGARTDAIMDDDAEWVRERFEKANAMAATSETFSFALEAGIDWRYAKDQRAAVARLWSGIEALFGIRSELQYRVSMLAAALLCPRGPSRKTKYESIRKLYDTRSKAVHGEPLPTQVLDKAVYDSYSLLRDLLVLAIDRGKVLTDDDFDRAVFF